VSAAEQGTFGRALLVIGLGVAVYGIGASVYGAVRRDRRAVRSGRDAVFTLAGLLTLAMAIVEVAFLRSDFHFTLVASHSSTTTPTLFQIAAPWSSQEGSLLLWVWLLSVWSSLALLTAGRRAPHVRPVATAVLLGFATFFCAVMLGFADPFATTATAPTEGAGLNPLLRHGSMLIHPPLLYSGYTLFTIPFAFAIGALVTRRLDSEWIVLTRRFTLAAWLLLGAGILFGARWSYTELGWGGYWAWDPVENASLMPWITGTAFLHSVMIQQRRGMLKVWNASLILATGTLAIMGTFLVRSGILSSIHAFGASTLGVPFVVLIAAMIAGSAWLVASRRAHLRSEHQLDSLLSREAIFLFQNLTLVALCFVIWWGTFFPLISEAVTGHKASVGPPWFDPYTVPLALMLVLLAGVGPVVAWRRASLTGLARHLALTGAVLAVAGLAVHVTALVMFALAAFLVTGVVGELVRGARVRRRLTGERAPRALAGLVARNRRRYGGYIAHVGIAVLFVGVAASSSFKHSLDAALKPGQSATTGGYTFRYVRATARPSAEKIALGAVIDVSKNGRPIATLDTDRGYYPSTDTSLGILGRFFNGAAESQIGLDAGWRRDYWAAINPDLGPLQAEIRRGDAVFKRAIDAATARGADRRQLARLYQVRDAAIVGLAQKFVTRPWPAQFRFIVSPMVTWIWLGALITIAGAVIALVPRRRAPRRAPATVAAPLPGSVDAEPVHA